MLLSGCWRRSSLITALPTTWLGRHAKGCVQMMLGAPWSIRSSISAVSSQPSPMLLHTESTVRALSAMVPMRSGASKRRDFSSISSTGVRIQSTSLMSACMPARVVAELPSSSFCSSALLMEYRKKSSRPGTTASQPSRSITSTTWLLAVGWNLTKISPTTPTRGLVPSPTSGMVSNARMASRHSLV